MGQGTDHGRWWCDGKPSEANFHIHSQDDVLARIEAATSPFARAGGVTGPYDPNKAQIDYPDGMQRMPVYGQVDQSRGAPPRNENEPSVDFEDIQDEWAYRLAQQLYHDERPDETVEIGRDTFMLFEEDRAVLRVTARRSVDIVDIETFRSDRGLDDFWEEVLDHSAN